MLTSSTSPGLHSSLAHNSHFGLCASVSVSGSLHPDGNASRIGLPYTWQQTGQALNWFSPGVFISGVFRQHIKWCHLQNHSENSVMLGGSFCSQTHFPNLSLALFAALFGLWYLRVRSRVLNTHVAIQTTHMSECLRSSQSAASSRLL